MREIHPFGVFAPPKAKYLILGSFIAIRKEDDSSYDFYYCSKRNQFWRIMEVVYKTELPDKKAKQDLLAKLSIAMADIIRQCERKNGSSLDADLKNCVYNLPTLAKLLKENPIRKIFFTSRFVETEFKKHFKSLIQRYPHIKLIALPSPSPRYASMRKEEKIKRYSQILRKLTTIPSFPLTKAL